MPTEQEEMDAAVEQMLQAITKFHEKLDAILERVNQLEKLIMDADIEILEEEKEEEELPCSQPRDVDFWIDREAVARSKQATAQVPRAYPWNRKCDWTYK